MKPSQQIARALVISGLLVLLGVFNNCSPFYSAKDSPVITSASQSDNLSAAQIVCEGQLKAAFQRTYHPFLVSNCNSCHGSAHGSSNLSVSFTSFQKRGETLIDYQATHAHGGNNFGTHMQPQLNVIKPSWTEANDEYLDCMAQAASSSGGTGSARQLRLIGKSNIQNLMGTLNNNNWVPIEWDLSNDVPGGYRGIFNAVLRVEAKIMNVGGAPGGLLLRNPTMRLKSGASRLQIHGIMILLDSRVQAAVTTFSGISRVVASSTNTALVDGSGSAYAAYPNISDSTLISLEINELKETALLPSVPEIPDIVLVPVVVPDVPIPTAGVKHSELINGNSPYRVFNRSCTGCHNSGSGRLDLTNYTAASAASALIISRMNSTASPMPPTGLLRQNDRDLVRSWVNAGTPQ